MKNPKDSFAAASYLSQVRKLRMLAQKVLTHYSIKAKQVKFINHGENATFKIETNKKDYLLRVHRANYHSKAGLVEELNWLENLNREGLVSVQKPVLNKSGAMLTEEFIDPYSKRYCDLLEWQPGKMYYDRVSAKRYEALGTLLARLHNNGSKFKSRHRQYWSIEGLLGRKATFGPLEDGKEFFGKNFLVLTDCRKMAKQKISRYEKVNLKSQFMIHADLHFGNMVWQGYNPLPIDFDDCGVGCFLYDLAVTFYAGGPPFKKLTKKQRLGRVNSLLDSYNKIRTLSDQEVELIDYYVLARKLGMMGWLFNRRDNPQLFEHLKKTKNDRIRYFKKIANHGPESIFD